MFANDYERAIGIPFGVTNKFQQVGNFANTECVNNEDW